ncbi:MAG: 2-hydroxyacid dehydrogenase [Bacteroidota bacterium]
MKVAVFSAKPYDKEYFESLNSEFQFNITFFESALNESTVNLCLGYNVVCAFVNDNLNSTVVKALSNNGIKMIAMRCAGFNNVDIKSSMHHGVKVARVPAYSPEAIAEHSLALILTLNRKTHKAYNRVREGNFSVDRLMGFNLAGKTVGVIGTGKIGAAFAKTIMGFGCNVIAYDPYPSKALMEEYVKYTDLDSLFASSDIISLHCPLTPGTKHMICESSLTKMKNGVMIINTSRGALIKTSDVLQALMNKKIGYLGIDVYEQEENLFFEDLSERIIQDDTILRLNSFPNVLITSHQAFFTAEAMTEIVSTTLYNIHEFSAGKPLTNEVSPEMVR